MNRLMINGKDFGEFGNPCFCPNTKSMSGRNYINFHTLVQREFEKICRNRRVCNQKFTCTCDDCKFHIVRTSVTYFMYKAIKAHSFNNPDHCLHFNMEGDIPA